MDLNLYDLYRALLNDVGADSYTVAYVLRRLLNEGHRFVTVELPAFSKHVLRCVETGIWTSCGTSFKVHRGLPLLFGGYLRELFIYNSVSKQMVIKENPCPVALYAIRQVCEYSYKLALPFTDAQLESAEETFLNNDSSLPSVGEYDQSFVDAMRKNFLRYYPTCASVDLHMTTTSAHPGPGSFSGSRSDFWKRNYLAQTVSVGDLPYAYGFRFNKRAPRAKEVYEVPYSEVLFVPKDSRGPRTIVREPYTKLLFQMGYNTQMSKALEYDTRFRVNFADQSINKDLAMQSSVHRKLCTLDLKDASDRVSYAIVRHLFRYTPVYNVIEKFRTSLAKLPSGRIIKLRKLAGMGSGFTFPTMALVIHLAICTQISSATHLPYASIMKQVYVYGDDIVLPTGWYDFALQGLTLVGLNVNTQKSYYKGHFRESCGGDYLYGNDVTPVRLKMASAAPSASGVIVKFDKVDPAIVSLVAHANELYLKQNFITAEYLYRKVETILGPLPYVSSTSQIIGRVADEDKIRGLLSQDPAGNYQRESFWVVRPVRKPVHGACPYQYMSRTLFKDRMTLWHRDIFPAGSRSEFGTATVPRQIKLHRRKLSSFAQL